MEDSKRVAPIYEMKVWDAMAPNEDLNKIEFSKGKTPLGYIIENKLMLAAMQEQIQQYPNVDVFAPEKIENIQWTGKDEDWVHVTLKSGNSIQTRLLVGADGANSIVRQTAEIPTIGWSYNQNGLVCSVKLAQPNRTAWQRFLPTGPIALLPVWSFLFI